MKNNKKYCLDFSEISKSDISTAGGKGANLGEMFSSGFPVPQGFVVTSNAYYNFLDSTSLREKISHELKKLNVNDSKALQRATKNIRVAILRAKMPKEIEKQIKDYYHNICGNKDKPVAVRSSATAEDLPDASFAGQQDTYLNIKGWRNVVKHTQKCWSSLFTARATFYRQTKGFDHFKVGIAVPVQVMIESEVSGIMFTVNPITNNDRQIAIEAGYGLGQTIVSGEITPDQYIVAKNDFTITDKNITRQTWQLTRGGKTKISKNYQEKQKLKNEYIEKLAKIGKAIEDHYGRPQDIEWVYNAKKLYIVQSRPVTTLGDDSSKERYSIKKTDKDFILEGLGASPGASSGKVRILKNAKELSKLIEGEVLVAKMTNPDFVPAMKRACAIVTDEGGKTSHAAIVSRELGIPCIVGTTNATKMLKNGEEISVDGISGRVYLGGLKGKNLSKMESFTKFKDTKTATKVYLNLAEPFLAQDLASKNTDGVGLLRAEFMIAQIGKHPRLFIKQKKQKEFIEKLATGIEQIAGAFYPRPVVYRATDFRTNEYRDLKGGMEFEGEEANPMIGFRGVSRYVVNDDVFELELQAIKNVRNKKNLANLHLMLPFVRTVDELIKCKKIIASLGLRRGPRFKLWIMVEVPSTVIILDDFIDAGVDGVSIGSNDLTQLILGLDRDNTKISHLFDERNPAVLWALEKVIKTCAKRKITSSICGQAPSEYPELVKKLVRWGVTSVSVSPDVLDATRGVVYYAEKDLFAKKSK